MNKTNQRGRSLTVRRMWSEQELAYLDAHYPKTATGEIARYLGRSLPSIKIQAVSRGLSKHPSFIKASQIKPGNVPWNKGLKGWKAAGSEKGYFPKGNTPHNAVGYYDGMVVTRQKKGEPPYRYRRLGKSQWVLSHRYNWQQVHGPIPAHHILRCLDGNTLHDAASNWELIHRQEHARRNAIHTENRAALQLTDSYVAATLTKGRPDLRPGALDNPDLLDAQRLRLTLNRTITHVLETQAR